MDATGFDYEEEDPHLAEWYWGDFEEWVRQALVNDFSPKLDSPYDTTWIEDEVQLILSHRLARVTLSEYCGLACVSLVPVEPTFEGSWGAERNHVYPLSEHWCCDKSGSFQEALQARFEIYAGGSYASNGSRMYHKVS